MFSLRQLFLSVLVSLLADLSIGKCPSADLSLCKCAEEAARPNQLIVTCDGMATVPDLKYQLDAFDWKEISELAVLRQKSFAGLRPDFFNQMPNLVRLSLAANPNSNFKPPVGLFDKLGPKLSVLDMSTSNLTEKELSPELFAPLVNLKELDLSYNQITQLRPTVFQSLAKLRVLDLGDNKLTVLPPFMLAKNKRLKMLDLNDNLLTELPMDLFDDEQKEMKILDIGGNRITKLTADHLVLMPNLTVLDARRNMINPLPSNLFSKSPQLQRISLDGVTAPVVPASLFNGLPLESLDLSDAVNVRSLPEDLLAPVGKTLKELHLDDNQKLFSLPPNFFRGLDALEMLDLSNTGLDLLPTSFFSDLKSLRRLKISDNQYLISLPPPKDYSPNLKSIDAKNCPKLPPVVTKWINTNFDTKPQMMDFPINIYRSANKDMMLRMAAATSTGPAATTSRPTQPSNQYNGNGRGNGNNGWNNKDNEGWAADGDNGNSNNNNNYNNNYNSGGWGGWRR
ncbi:hypothetical protein RvY_05974 [Ramazzottius varieornatus]|uniref:LRRCT domain-containing protein n=1 Tax=Ramazzottius varieornatus TaxID=947166 RepID=A0A1D1V6K3_RAMVA|nr:hypothetical protein RvY_05974 [Ramazzottius varieornatus]